MTFDILYSDVQTSLVLSAHGHKIYVLYLDDYSNFLWTFPISHKSRVFLTFEHLIAYIKTQFQHEVKIFNVIMVENMLIVIFKNFVKQMEFSFGKANENIVPLIR